MAKKKKKPTLSICEMGSVTSDSCSQDLAFRRGKESSFPFVCRHMKAEKSFPCQLKPLIWKMKWSLTKGETPKPMWIKECSIGINDTARVGNHNKDFFRSGKQNTLHKHRMGLSLMTLPKINWVIVWHLHRQWCKFP